MASPNNLQRFITAQENTWQNALTEIEQGRKRGHWIWFIFPQVQGLGFSTTSVFYAIKNKREAEDFLNHPVLGSRLIQISNALLKLETNDAHTVFGSPDDQKLRSSMTLFSSLDNADNVFKLVLDKFFDGKKDAITLTLMDNNKF